MDPDPEKSMKGALFLVLKSSRVHSQFVCSQVSVRARRSVRIACVWCEPVHLRQGASQRFDRGLGRVPRRFPQVLHVNIVSFLQEKIAPLGKISPGLASKSKVLSSMFYASKNG